MMNLLKTAILSILIWAFSSSNIFSQVDSTGYFFKYDFRDFLINKTINKKQYLTHIYKGLSFPSEEREYKIEGVIRILIINYSMDAFEVVALNDISDLDEVAVSAIKNAHNDLALKSKEKYITEITVGFEYQEDGEWRDNKKINHADIMVFTSPPSHK